MRREIYELLARPTQADKEAFFEQYFSSCRAVPERGDALYFPFFARVDVEVREALLDFLKRQNGTVVLEKVFPERNGQPAILLYRLDSARRFIEDRFALIRQARPLPKLRIERFGPERVKAGADRDLPMWFIASDLTATTQVALEGGLLSTIFGGDHVTALVPRRALEKPGRRSLFLYDPSRQGRSPAVELQVD